jgi:hypothetical protein
MHIASQSRAARMVFVMVDRLPVSGHRQAGSETQRENRGSTMKVRVMTALSLVLVMLAVAAQAAGPAVARSQHAQSSPRPVKPGPKPDLTYGGAEEWTKYWSEVEWGIGSVVFANGCHNTGENREGHTQWYCYGEMTHQCLEWQVNVGPYGERTYIADLGCPSVVKQ